MYCWVCREPGDHRTKHRALRDAGLVYVHPETKSLMRKPDWDEEKAARLSPEIQREVARAQPGAPKPPMRPRVPPKTPAVVTHHPTAKEQSDDFMWGLVVLGVLALLVWGVVAAIGAVSGGGSDPYEPPDGPAYEYRDRCSDWQARENPGREVQNEIETHC